MTLYSHQPHVRACVHTHTHTHTHAHTHTRTHAHAHTHTHTPLFQTNLHVCPMSTQLHIHLQVPPEFKVTQMSQSSQEIPMKKFLLV
ncbi:rCG55116, partial [Rattus norvegicus]